VGSNPKPLPPNPASLPAPAEFSPVEPEDADELVFTDYWSSPLGMAALADWDEDDE
jgi:hypothetical protein